MKKLIIAGGTGFLGQALINQFLDEMDEIVILSRKPSHNVGKITYLQWDAKMLGSWCPKLEGATALVNLCGRNVDCRYTDENKALILSSRIDSTRVLGEAILKCQDPPKIWMNSASATIYGYSEQTPMPESSGKIGEGFSVEVCKAWEQAFNEFNLPKTRKVTLRISLIFGNSGGVFPVLTKLTKRLLGGKMGTGKQQFAWMHIDDFCGAIKWLMETETARGPYNLVAPAPVTNAALMKMLRKKLGVPFGLPAPKWILEIGAFIIRTETELILKSRYPVPERLLNEGYKFKYGTIEECLDNLL